MMKKKLAALMSLALIVCLGLTMAALPAANAGWYNSTVLTDDFDNATPFAANFNVVGNGGGSITPVVTGNGLLRLSGSGSRGLVTQAPLDAAGSYIAIEYDLVGVTGGYIHIMKGSAVRDLLTGDVYSYVGAGDPRSGKGMWGDPTGFLFLDRQVAPETATWETNGWVSYGLKNNFRYKQQFNADGSFVSSIKDLSVSGAPYLDVVKAPAGTYSTTLDGHVGIQFTNGSASMEIRNLLITDGEGNTLLSDPLTSTISVTTSQSASHTWQALGDDFAVAVLGPTSISFEDSPAAAQMIFKTNLDFVETAKYAVSFKAKFLDIADGRFGVAFGGASNTEALETSEQHPLTVAAFYGEGGALKLGALHGAQELASVTALESTEGLADNWATLKFVPKHEADGSYSLAVYFDGALLQTYAGISAAGYMAIVMDADDMEVMIDDFKFERTAIVNFDSADVFQDFEEEIELSADIEDDWLYKTYGTNPADETQGLFIRDGKLVFDNAADGAYFGPNKQYGNWELKLELSDINKTRISDDDDNVIRDVSTQLMIGFARKEYGVNYMTSNSSLLMIDSNPWAGGAPGSGRAILFEKSVMNNDITYNFPNAWSESNGTAYIRLVAYNESLYLFVWYQGMDEAYKDIPAHVWTGVDTVGYIALCSTTNASFSIDNFSVANLDGKSLPAFKAESALTTVTPKTAADKDAYVGEAVSVSLSDMFTVAGEFSSQVAYTASKGTISGGVWTYTPSEAVVDDIVITAHYFGKTAEYKFAVSATKKLRSCFGAAAGGTMLAAAAVTLAGLVLLGRKSAKKEI